MHYTELKKAWGELTAPGAPFEIATVEVRGVPIYGSPCDHETKENPEYHKNTIFHFVIEDMNVVHLGGTRLPLTDEQIGQIGGGVRRAHVAGWLAGTASFSPPKPCMRSAHCRPMSAPLMRGSNSRHITTVRTVVMDQGR